MYDVKSPLNELGDWSAVDYTLYGSGKSLVGGSALRRC